MKMNDEYFARGFLDRLSSHFDLEKLAQYDQPNFGEKLGDKFSEAMANAMAFGAVSAIQSGYRSTAGAIGPRLSPLQKRFIKQLMKRDMTLKDRPKERVMSHYITLANLAPSISKDANVVASFLRQSTAYDTIDTVMIKTLIDIESGYRERERSQLDILGKYTKRGVR